METSVLLQLRSGLNYLSGTQLRIARTVLEDPEGFTRLSMQEAAQRCGVSQGSIVNFSRKFADGGFPTLKLKIAACLHSEAEEPLSVVDSGDTVREALAKNMAAQNRAFEITAEVNSEQTLRSAADRILGARKIEIYGIYRSAAVAMDFYFQLLQLGLPVSFVSDVLTCAVSASMLDENSLVIAVSASGNTREILNAVKNARKRGAAVVCLTGNADSPLARLSDDVLVAAAGVTSVSGRSPEIRSSQLLLTDTLCSYLLSRMNEAERERFFELNRILKTYNVND